MDWAGFGMPTLCAGDTLLLIPRRSFRVIRDEAVLQRLVYGKIELFVHILVLLCGISDSVVKFSIHEPTI